jgi:hypothetical protein
VETVEVLPHLAADLLAHAARVLARPREAHEHRAGIGGVGVQELEHGALVALGTDALEERGIAGDAHDVVQPAAPSVQAGLVVHRGQAGHRLRALDVARHPVQRLGYAREHGFIR